MAAEGLRAAVEAPALPTAAPVDGGGEVDRVTTSVDTLRAIFGRYGEKVRSLQDRINAQGTEVVEQREADRRRISQLESSLEQAERLASVRVEEAKAAAEDRASSAETRAALLIVDANTATAAAQEQLEQQALAIQELVKQIEPLSEQNRKLSGELAAAKVHLRTKTEAEGTREHFLRIQRKDAGTIQELEARVRALRDTLARVEKEGEQAVAPYRVEADLLIEKNRELKGKLDEAQRTLREVEERHQEEHTIIMEEIAFAQAIADGKERAFHRASELKVKKESADVRELKEALASEKAARNEAEGLALQAHERARDAAADGVALERERMKQKLLAEGGPFREVCAQVSEELRGALIAQLAQTFGAI